MEMARYRRLIAMRMRQIRPPEVTSKPAAANTSIANATASNSNSSAGNSSESSNATDSGNSTAHAAAREAAKAGLKFEPRNTVEVLDALVVKRMSSIGAPRPTSIMNMTTSDIVFQKAMASMTKGEEFAAAYCSCVALAL